VIQSPNSPHVSAAPAQSRGVGGSTWHLQDVDRLVASSGLHRLAESIVSVWYSGLFGTGEKARVLAYEEALAWRATGYAKAPGRVHPTKQVGAGLSTE
jgi:Membrane bound FAD containing D-sorbitol dehydrogenase